MTRMQWKWKKTASTSLFVLLCILMTGCALFGETNQGNVQGAGEGDAGMAEQGPAVMENSDGQMVFDMTLEDFTDQYNIVYRYEYGESFLPSAYQWAFYNTMAVHGDNAAICYHFSEDERVRAVPVISVFVPEMDAHVQQIMVSYDDHSYSIPTYEMYEELCFYTLKVMLPTLRDEELTKLYTEVNVLADENITYVPYAANAVPCTLYHKDGIGVYPYYCVGEELHLCIIPVTEETLADFEERGTVVRPIE